MPIVLLEGQGHRHKHGPHRWTCSRAHRWSAQQRKKCPDRDTGDGILEHKDQSQEELEARHQLQERRVRRRKLLTRRGRQHKRRRRKRGRLGKRLIELSLHTQNSRTVSGIEGHSSNFDTGVMSINIPCQPSQTADCGLGRACTTKYQTSTQDTAQARAKTQPKRCL